MTTNVSMSPEQLQHLVSSITNAAIQAAAQHTPPSAWCATSFANVNFSYDGTREEMKVEEFLSTASVYKSVNKISDDNAINTLPLILKGEASTWWQGVKKSIHTWNDFENSLRHAFAPKKTGVMIFQEVFSLRQSADMLTEVFVSRQRALLSQLPSPGLTEELELDAVYGQLHVRIREKVHRNNVTSFDELLDAARSIEKLYQEKSSAVGVYLTGNDNNKPKKKRCDYCRAIGHTVEVCRKRLRDSALPNKTEMKMTQAPSPSEPSVKCYGCGAPGVIRAKCPKCSENRSCKTEKVDFCAISVKTDTRPRPVVGIAVHDIVGTAYVDTCAKSSVASYQLYKLLKYRNCHFAQQTVTVTLADGVKRRENILSAIVPVRLCDRVIPTTFVVLPHSRENKTLLGVGFIEDAGMVLNIPQRTWHFVDNPYTHYDLAVEIVEDISVAQFDPSLRPATSLKEPRSTTMLEPREASSCAVQPKRPRQLFDGYEPSRFEYMYADAQRAVEESKIELSPETQALFPGFTPYSGEDIGLNILDIKETEMFNLEEDDSRLESSEVDLGNTEGEERETLQKLLHDFQNVFTPSKLPSSLAEHSIDTGDHRPIAVPPYRLSPARCSILKEEITKMLADDIIAPSSSPWSSPMVMVPKKNGAVRVCVDYRRLNSITVTDTYPMPRIDDLLQEAKPTAYMTTLDLRAGYWQVKVNEVDQDKTSFITPFGIYKFRRMPFGLKNAPATFQRLIDRVRVLVKDVKMLAYLDDLLILSTSFQHHIQDIRLVLTILQENNLTVNLSKCHFCCNRVKYLGHYLTPRGLEVDPEKIEAITQLTPPRNIKHLLSFIQTCSWYRRFIPNFAKISEPLTRLTRKNALWQWEEAQQKAFQELKEKLTTAPVLKQADMDTPYIIKTDASSYAIGAVLVQGEREEEHPIEYASRLLNSAERNYTTTEREALAVVWALMKFRGYIESTSVTVLTDHQALRWLLTLKTPTGRLARWALTIQAFDVEIKYVPGRTNVIADTLSRPFCEKEKENECGVCSVTIDLPPRSTAEIRQEQLKDEFIARIIKALESDSTEDAVYWSGKGYTMNHGVLYKYDPEGNGEDAQLLVPEHEWGNVLKIYHDDPLAGHYGADKTYQRIARRYYWKKMRKYIEAYVKKCLLCQRYKPSNLKPAGLLQTTAINQRFETLAFDLFGPLPTTATNKNWIFIVEDVATGWIELFALETANAETCATILIDEIFLRYGMPRRLHSDNGPQFVSAVMQKMTYCLDLKHSFTPVYHPAANPVERKNRDLKTQLAILVQDNHRNWSDKLAYIRFAMNTANSLVTGYTPAYLTFARELRTPDDIAHDLREVVLSENFIPEITPKLLLLAETLKRAKEVREGKEQARKEHSDKARRSDPGYKPGDLVLTQIHAVSKTSQGVSNKLVPRRDGPYLIKSKKGAASYVLSKPDNPDTIIGTYHTSALTPYTETGGEIPLPQRPIRKRGRPRKNPPNKTKTSTGRPRGRPKKQ